MNLDFDQWDEQHARLFDHALSQIADLDERAVISMTTNTPRSRRGEPVLGKKGELILDWNGSLGTAPVGDAERAWRRILANAKEGAACYFGIGVRRGGTRGQGGKNDLLCHTLLAADLDWAEGDHKASTNPPREVLEQWINDLPITPSLIVNSGGGYHVYVTLTEPIEVQRDTLGRSLYAGWRQWWLDRGAQDGYTVDIGPLTNEALVLRVAGTPCPKYPGTLVTIERSMETTDEHYDPSELAALFPAPPEEPKRTRTAGSKPSPSGTAGDAKTPVPAGGSLGDFTPGDLFAVEGDMERILVELLGAEYAGRSGDPGALLLPWTDCETVEPEYPQNKNAGVFIHFDGAPLLSIYGQGVREDWAYFAGTTPDQSREIDTYTAFYALSQVIARKGATAPESWTIAARLVVHYRSIDASSFADYGSLYDDLAAAYDLDEIIALAPERKRRVGSVRSIQAPTQVIETPGVRVLVDVRIELAESPKIRRL